MSSTSIGRLAPKIVVAPVGHIAGVGMALGSLRSLAWHHIQVGTIPTLMA